MSSAISLLFDIFGLPALIALVVAGITTWLNLRFVRSDRARRSTLPIAAVFAFWAGYLLLPRSFAALGPQEGRSWTWMPYIGLITAVLAASLPRSPRWYIWIPISLVTAALTAYLLAPTWPVYGFNRIPLVIFLTLYLLAIDVPLQGLPDRCRHAHFLVGLVGGICVLNSLAIGAMISANFAKLSALAAGTFMGTWLTLYLSSKGRSVAFGPLLALFAPLAGGIAWIACVELDPQPWLLVTPLLSLCAWLLVWQPAPFGPRQIS